MIRTYLERRDQLRGVVFILDIRRVPGDEDLRLLDWLEEYGVPTVPVITKIDKIGKPQRRKHVTRIAEATGLPLDSFSLFSALTGEGREEIWERVEEALDGIAEDSSDEA